MKIKIGMYAPTKGKAVPSDDENSPSAQRATGTEGISVNLRKEGTLFPFDPNRRAGSSTVGNGARGGT